MKPQSENYGTRPNISGDGTVSKNVLSVVFSGEKSSQFTWAYLFLYLCLLAN